MLEILKKLDWFYWAILTIAVVTAFFVNSRLAAEVPEIPFWYLQFGAAGMALTLVSVAVTIRLLVEVIYRIFRNAMAMGQRIP